MIAIEAKINMLQFANFFLKAKQKRKEKEICSEGKHFHINFNVLSYNFEMLCS